MRKLILVIVSMVLMTLSPRAFAGTEASKVYQVGDQVSVRAYCLTESAARQLAKLVKEKSITGYYAAMRSSAVECYDSRVHTELNTIRVTLKERIFETYVPKVGTMHFWLAVDVNNTPGYTWTWSTGQPV